MPSHMIGGTEVWFKLPIYQILAVHQIIIPYLWTVAINVAIFFALYKYRRYAILIHFIMTFSIAMFTLITSIPLLGIPSHTKPAFMHHMVLTMTNVILVLMFLEVIIGIGAKLLIFWKIKSVPQYKINKVHKWLGYFLTLLCKILSYLLIQKGIFYWIMAAQDVIFITLLVFRKYTMAKLQQRIEPTYEHLHVPIVSSFNEVKDKDKRDLCVFSNYVYDMKPLRHNHPAGYQILQLVRNRQIDRFMYGMFRAEALPKLPTNSHTAKSIELLGQPVALIKIKCPYRGMPEQPFKVVIEKLCQISTQSKIFEVYLKPHQAIEFSGYEHLSQLGRFYSFTINDKVTRLYTAVNFINHENKKFLKKIGLINIIPFSQSTTYAQSAQIEMITQRGLSKSYNSMPGVIPIMFKVYNGGTLPNMVVDGKLKKMILSPPKGFGLGFGEVKEGTILIMAGGTGVFPFSDLIDLLYKDYLVKCNSTFKQEIFIRNPILKNSPFDPFSFKFCIACEYLQDIHYITLKQIQALSYSKKIEVILKVKFVNEYKISTNERLKLTEEKFQDILDRQFEGIGRLEKVMVSGPPRMMESVSKYFQRKQSTHMLLLV